jgi:hypothetical protein
MAAGRYAAPLILQGERGVERLEVAFTGDDSDPAARRRQPAGDWAGDGGGSQDHPPLCQRRVDYRLIPAV